MGWNLSSRLCKLRSYTSTDSFLNPAPVKHPKGQHIICNWDESAIAAVSSVNRYTWGQGQTRVRAASTAHTVWPGEVWSLKLGIRVAVVIRLTSVALCCRPRENNTWETPGPTAGILTVKVGPRAAPTTVHFVSTQKSKRGHNWVHSQVNSSKRVKVSGFPTSGSALILTTSYNRSESQLGDRFGNLHFKNYGGDLAHDRAVTATEHTGGHTQHLGQAPITAVQFSSVTQSCPTLRPHGLQHARLPCPSPTPGVYSNSCPSSRWCHPTISPSVLSSPPAFNLSQHQDLSNESALCIRWPKYWSFSSSISPPKNIQDLHPLGLTGWVSFQSKGLSRVFSNTTVQKHQFLSTQLSLQSTSHIHTWLLEKPQLWLDGPLLAK